MATNRLELPSRSISQDEHLSWTTSIKILAIALFELVVTLLHLLGPELDLPQGTTIFLWPFSSIRVVTPLSILYSLFLLSFTLRHNRVDSRLYLAPPTEMILDLDLSSFAKLDLLLFTGSMSALSINVDLLRCFLALVHYMFKEMSPYEMGNASIESWYLIASLLAMVPALMCLTVAWILWIPIIALIQCRPLVARLSQQPISSPGMHAENFGTNPQRDDSSRATPVLSTSLVTVQGQATSISSGYGVAIMEDWDVVGPTNIEILLMEQTYDSI
ncbi:hypothetical protein ACLMJK_001646 [Lecanora helva]